MSRRVGIYDTLEKCFQTSSRSQQQAIDNAHFKRDLKEAVDQGDVDKVKQLTLGDAIKQVNVETWGSRKFSAKDE